MSQPNQPPSAVPGWTPPAAKPKKPIWQRWWFIALVAIFVIGGLGRAFGGSQEPTTAAPAVTTSAPAGQPSATAPEDQPASTKAPEPKETKPAGPELTTSQLNAMRKAKEYLDLSAFSRKGLIGQLKYEGFSTKDATFAVDHIVVSWKEQAALKAQEYLDSSAFSRSGLIAQLEYEGFTSSEARYGVKQVGL